MQGVGQNQQVQEITHREESKDRPVLPQGQKEPGHITRRKGERSKETTLFGFLFESGGSQGLSQKKMKFRRAQGGAKNKNVEMGERRTGARDISGKKRERRMYS